MKQPSQPAQPGKPRIAAAIPAFNEETYIGTIVLKTRQYVDEVIVADDGSSDQTAIIARLAGATVIRHEKNKGYGASIKDMLAEARKKDIGILVLLDGDSQHNPDDIPALIKPITEGFDVVIGSRSQQKEKIPTYRRAGQKVIANFSHVLSGENLSDSESGFRAFSRKAIELLNLQEDGMSISAETISRATENGLKITETPISIRYTDDGSTLNPVMHGLGVLARIIVMISERRPLFLYGLGGFILVLLGLLAGIRAIAIVMDGGGALNGWTIVSGLLLLIGILSGFTGIILNALIRRKS